MYLWLCMAVGRAVWYPGRGCSSWVLLLLAMGEVVRVAVCRFCAPRICGIISGRSNLYAKGNRTLVLNFIGGTLTYFWNPISHNKTPAHPLTWDDHMYPSPQQRPRPKLTSSSHHAATTPRRPAYTHEIPEKTMCQDKKQWQHTASSSPNVQHTEVSVLI